MSGGVDSSVSAVLLREAGYRVIGLFMITGAVTGGETGAGARRCCAATDKKDAERVAGLLGIPFYAQDFRREFDRIREDFVQEYRRGRTPNPCLRCNQWVKFGSLLEKADALGADLVATGHYARVERSGGHYLLRNSRDTDKNQTYFLFTLGQRELGRILFPVGDLTKDEVRNLARRAGLPTSEKPESQDVCFVSGTTYHDFVLARGGPSPPGPIVLSDGREVGRHQGTIRFTVGQRRGLGVALGHRHYVTRIDVERNEVVVGPEEELCGSSFTVDELSWVDGMARDDTVEALVQIRYRHRPVEAIIHPLGERRARIEVPGSEKGITPGQAAVFYRGDVVLGGGIIES
jgi:tRNA-specific 2-thiouridylase